MQRYRRLREEISKVIVGQDAVVESLLEAMQEQSVTVAGKIHRLDEPFFVLATQNPLEQEGTYPLPEAQLDRFLFKILVPFPTLSDLSAIIDRTTGTHEANVQPALDGGQVM